MPHSPSSWIASPAATRLARQCRRIPALAYPLTLITDVDNGNSLVDEEQFGPILPIIRYSDLDEVIERANNNPNGLGGSVWSKDVQKVKEIALRLQCDTAWINKHSPLQPNVPFGGVKSSGVGVEFGEEGLFEKYRYPEFGPNRFVFGRREICCSILRMTNAPCSSGSAAHFVFALAIRERKPSEFGLLQRHAELWFRASRHTWHKFHHPPVRCSHRCEDLIRERIGSRMNCRSSVAQKALCDHKT